MSFSVASVYILNIPGYIDRLFDYYIPDDLSEYVSKGNIVTVPFGGGNKHMTAAVFSLCKTDETSSLKPIISVSPHIVLSDEDMGLCLFLKEHTFCSFGEAVRTIIPQTVLNNVNEYYSASQNQTDGSLLNNKAFLVYQHIRENPGISLAGLVKKFGDDVTTALKALKKLDYVTVSSELMESKNIKTKEYLTLAFDKNEISGLKLRSKKHTEIILYLASQGRTESEILKRELSVTAAQIKALADKGFINSEKIDAYRNPYENAGNSTVCSKLSQAQSEAYAKIEEKINTGKPEAILLFGITGSGKTRVIKEAIDKVIACKKQVILLVPEIALTPQTVGIFCSYYGNRIAVLHSSLSSGERYDAWRKIKNGQVDICIGTRSAVFAPFERLGMIVIDEEHEHTYKSEQSPRYNAIDVARWRVNYNNALMLLSSATPSLESYYKAQKGLYTLVELNCRYGTSQIPETVICDLRLDAANNNKSPIGMILQDALKDRLEKKEQSIFFINRRGYNNFLTCPMCGYVVTCPHCSVSLTHHMSRGKSRLICHYCGYMEDIPTKCPECASDTFSYIGFGTQLAQESINELFPQANIMRMDADTTSTKFSYDKMLAEFREQKADILLGTQMVTKGHDFPSVTLVGVLLADTTLYLDDFRANERTFQLVTQVIGRAGRAEKHGIAIIQTYNPEHPSLLLAAAQDYKAFYKDEIAMRRALTFPPFCDIALISFSSTDESVLRNAIIDYDRRFRTLVSGEYADVKVVFFGPFEAPVYKVNEHYRMRFVIKCKSNKRTRELFSNLLNEYSKKYGRKITISIDINPNSI